jgi:hypothetical protein
VEIVAFYLNRGEQRLRYEKLTTSSKGTPRYSGVWLLDAGGEGHRIVEERSMCKNRNQSVANDPRWSERLSQGA